MFEATSDCQHYLGIAARAGVNKDTEYNSFATSQLSRISQTIRSVEICLSGNCQQEVGQLRRSKRRRKHEQRCSALANSR